MRKNSNFFSEIILFLLAQYSINITGFIYNVLLRVIANKNLSILLINVMLFVIIYLAKKRWIAKKGVVSQ